MIGDTPGSGSVNFAAPIGWTEHADQEVGIATEHLALGSAYDATPETGTATALANRNFPWGAIAVYVTC